MEHGTVTLDTAYLGQKNKSEFSNLYNPSINSSFDPKFRNSAMYQNQVFEQNMIEPTYISKPFLNKPIEVNEINNVVFRDKDGKSTGIDNLPAEVLGNETVMKALHKLLNFIFESNKIPSV